MPNIQIRVDENLKKQAQEVATALGMEVATAIRIFLSQMVRDRALPFTPTLSTKLQSEYKCKDLGADFTEIENIDRKEWLRNAVKTGLKALENNDYATDEEVAETFRKAGIDVS